MGLPRLILVVLICAAGYVLWKKFQRQQIARQNQTSNQPDENMVQCRHCALFLPQQQAVRKANQWFCCDDHARHG